MSLERKEIIVFVARVIFEKIIKTATKRVIIIED